MDSTNSIKWPGPWLDEELTEAESAEVMQLIDLIKEAQAQGVKVEYTETGGMGKEWGETMLKFIPYLNSFMHLVYRLARDGDMPDWIIKDPVGATTSIIEFMCSGAGDQIPGQLTLMEPQRGTIEAESKALIVQAIRAQRIEYPIDKVNSEIWRLLETPTGGQIALKVEKSGSKKPLNILYSIDFDALEMDEGITITKRLLPFDKRVYIAVSALYNAGCEVITLTQIYYAMGYTGNPGKKDLERINNSITKMAGATVYVNNKDEAAVYNYIKFVYDGPLLPLERVSAVINGKATEAAIHPFREPPIISFAKQRKQITTIDMKLLQSPISKSDGNLLIEDYLIERIAKAKNGTGQPRILFKTLYEKARITTVKQKQRAPAKIKRYLDHYQKCGLILKYTMDSDGVTVFFKNEEPTKETAATA